MLKLLRQNGRMDTESLTVGIDIGMAESQTILERLAGFQEYWSDYAPKSWKVIEDIKINYGDIELAEKQGYEFMDSKRDLVGLAGLNNGSTVGLARSVVQRARTDLDKLQEYANMNNLGGQAGIYLINCNSLNCIACSDSAYAAAGTWNNLALRQAQMEFADTHDYQFYIAKMQNGIKGDTVRYRVNGVDYTQGYERIDKMKGWYLAVELSDTAMSGSFNMFQDRLMAYGGLLLLATLVACIVLIVMEISQKKSFEKLSSIDAMTGLYNKKTFTALVEDYLTYEKDPGVLIFVDVDNFKIYNDQYGHLNGDAVLKKFARELLEEFSQTGIVGRYGGDEFTVFLKSVSSQEYVNRAMERLEKKLSAIELEEFGEVALSFSAGGARYPQDGSTFVELCKLADDALYRVKADGKGKYYWYQ